MGDKPKLEYYRKVFKKGEVIVQEGEPSNQTMYFVLTGNLKVVKNIDGETVELDNLGPEDFFGEMALVTNMPRSATVIATSDSQILEINKNNFAKIITESPRLAYIIIYKLSKRIAQLHDKIKDLMGEKRSLEEILAQMSS